MLFLREQIVLIRRKTVPVALNTCNPLYRGTVPRKLSALDNGPASRFLYAPSRLFV